MVHRLSRSSLSTLGSTGSALGRVEAFDVLVGLTSTSDGGTALVTTKQLEPPIQLGFDNTDAFVAKLSATAAVEWTTTYDARTSRLHTETGCTYEKHQECLYDIAETESGGFVIAGNNSSNLDDGYVLRFGAAKTAAFPATTVANSHLVYPSPHVSYATQMTGGLEVAETGEVWVDPGRTLNFGQGTHLRVSGTMQATGATLTAAEPSDGWSGVRFEPGASGSLRNAGPVATTISEVNGYGASVYIHNAEVTLKDVRLDGRPQGVDQDIRVAGVLARGGDALVSVSGAVITDHTDYALRVSGGARLYASDNTLANSVLAYGSYAGADVFLWENTSTHGASAQSYGTLWLGPPDLSYTPDLPNNDLGGGSPSAALLAWNRGEVWGGMEEDGFASNNHLFRENDERGYAIAQYYSDVTARYNWWGDPSGPDPSLVEVDVSSVLDYCPWLTDPTAGSPGGICSLTGVVWGAAPPVPDGAAGHLWRAREAVAEGRYGDGLGSLQQAMQTDGADDALRHRAVRLLTTLLRRADEAGQAQVVTQAETFLRAQVAGGGMLRPWAVQALAHLEAGRGRHDEALALADSLVGEGGEHALLGHLIRPFALASLGHDGEAEVALAGAEAALATTQPEAVGSEVVAVREELELWLGRSLEVSAARPGEGGGVAAHTSLPSGDATLAVYPNPVQELAHLVFTLPEASVVRVSLFDVLGREVAVLADRAFDAGSHILELDAVHRPAGVYVVRATGGGAVTTRRVTVLR